MEHSELLTPESGCSIHGFPKRLQSALFSVNLVHSAEPVQFSDWRCSPERSDSNMPIFLLAFAVLRRAGWLNVLSGGLTELQADFSYATSCTSGVLHLISL